MPKKEQKKKEKDDIFNTTYKPAEIMDMMENLGLSEEDIKGEADFLEKVEEIKTKTLPDGDIEIEITFNEDADLDDWDFEFEDLEFEEEDEDD